MWLETDNLRPNAVRIFRSAGGISGRCAVHAEAASSSLRVHPRLIRRIFHAGYPDHLDPVVSDLWLAN